MTAIAARRRLFADPHPVEDLKARAIESRRRFESMRNDRIDELVARAPDGSRDRTYWTLVYDLEHAPTTSGRAILLEHGIVPVPPQELIDDASVHDEAWTVIEALAKSGVFLLNTDHLADRELYARLYYRILDEECRAIPPASEASEFIDCLHPLDLNHRLGTAIAERTSAFNATRAAYERGPLCATLGVLCNRDEFLPRPSWQG